MGKLKDGHKQNSEEMAYSSVNWTGINLLLLLKRCPAKTPKVDGF
jgi:hypothetical protein